MTESDRRFGYFVFGALGVVIGLYFLWRVIPYFLFYVVPFLSFAFIAGCFWSAVSKVQEIKYSRLGLFIPLTGLALFFLVGFPRESIIEIPRLVPIESPWLNDWFNSVNRSFQQGVVNVTPNAFLWFAPDLNYRWVNYDWKDLAYILWFRI